MYVIIVCNKEKATVENVLSTYMSVNLTLLFCHTKSPHYFRKRHMFNAKRVKHAPGTILGCV